jgi:hypothetical protein
MAKVALAAAIALFILPLANAGAVCTSQQVENQSNIVLNRLVGNSSWVSQYYAFKGFGANPAIYNLNYTRNTTNGYILDVSYNNFTGPGNMSHDYPTTLTFKLTSNTTAACSKLVFWFGSDIVQPYNTSKFITPVQASSIAKSKGYEVNFTFPTLSLYVDKENSPSGAFLSVPNTSSGFFVPAYYTGYNSQFGITVNAENGTLQLDYYPQPGGIVNPSPQPSLAAASTTPPASSTIAAPLTTAATTTVGNGRSNQVNGSMPASYVLVGVIIVAIIILAYVLSKRAKRMGP